MYIKAKELTKRGFPESTIRQFEHMEGSPFFQKKPGGTWWVKLEDFEKWLTTLAERKEVYA